MEIDIYTKSGVYITSVDKVFSCDAKETLAGVYTLNFETLLTENLEGIDSNTDYMLFFQNEYYDVKTIKKSLSSGLYKIKIEAEHISYRLSGFTRNTYIFTGTVKQILSEVLSGTGFLVGSVDIPDAHSIEIKDNTTVRSIIFTLASDLNADVEFRGYNVSMYQHKGRLSPVSIVDKNVVAISKSLKSTQATPIYSLTIREKLGLVVGDELHLKFDKLSINENVRLIGMKKKPFTSKNIELEIGASEGTIEQDLVTIAKENISRGESVYGVKISTQEGLTITRDDGKSKVIMNADEFRMQAKDGDGVLRDKLYFDPETESYKFVGSVDIKEGIININDNFKVDQNGNVYMCGDSTIYGGKYYAGSPLSQDGYSQMTDTGFEVFNSDRDLKLKLGYTTDGEDYPFLQLGSGRGQYTDFGLVKKFTDGLWIGNSEPEDESGEFVAQQGYNGIFFRFSDNTAYVVKDDEMKNIYTGHAIAKFG